MDIHWPGMPDLHQDRVTFCRTGHRGGRGWWEGRTVIVLCVGRVLQEADQAQEGGRM